MIKHAKNNFLVVFFGQISESNVRLFVCSSHLLALIHPFIFCLSVNVSPYLPTYLSVYLPNFLSVYRSIYTVYLSSYRFIIFLVRFLYFFLFSFSLCLFFLPFLSYLFCCLSHTPLSSSISIYINRFLVS